MNDKQKGEVGVQLLKALAVLWLVHCIMGCTTGGGKVCFGYEEVNSIKNSSGYEIPKGKNETSK